MCVVQRSQRWCGTLINCDMTHFVDGFTLFIGKDLTVRSGWLIRGESLSLNTRQRTQGKKLLVYAWHDGLRLVIATLRTEILQWCWIGHWVCLSCAQWQGKRKPNSGRCKEREREKGNLCVPLFHDMLTGYAGYWTTWIFSLNWGCPFHVAYMMSYVYIYTRYVFYCVSIGSTYSQSLSGFFSFCCARGCPRPFRAFLFPQLTATLLSAQWFSRKLLKI